MKTKQHDNTIQAPKHLSPWMDTEEAAAYMGSTVSSLKRWRCEGKGPRFITVNRKLVRYNVKDIDAFINEPGR